MTTAPLTASKRLAEIDLLRGLVIMLMALDHVRDYLHAGGLAIDPLNPDETNAWLYTTRWITHFCAPTFVFLSGVSAWLQFERGKKTPNLSLFLLTRGIWLILLEVTVLSFGWSFGFPYPPFLQVIWAIGWSMIALSALVWLPRVAVLGIGIAIVAGHNLLDPIDPQHFGAYANLWTMFHQGGLLFLNDAPFALNPYPIFPWIGVMALGYGMGALFTQAPEKRNRTLIALGLGMIALFLVLRGFNLYGNPAPVESQQVGPFGGTENWQTQEGLRAQIMTFFDVQKYPPSLMFVLITLGPMLTLLPFLARLRGPVANVLGTFGAVPFFFYVLHIYVVHLLAIGVNVALGRDPGALFGYFMNLFQAPERFEGLGVPLWGVYLAWIAVLVILYFPCRYWAELKRTRKDWWLSYL